jgi:hypothetical protein
MAAKVYYILMSDGFDGQGVMWIGTDLEVGKSQADHYASNHDGDQYYFSLMLHKDALAINHTQPPAEMEFEWEAVGEHIHTGIDERKV